MSYSIENMEQYLQQYDKFLSVEEKRSYKNQIEEYEVVKLHIELAIGNRAIEEQKR